MNEITENKESNGAYAMFRPKFALYHANPKGTGSAIKMELHPAHDRVAGSIWFTLAPQCQIGNRRGPEPTYPRFDWENALSIKLDFDDLCKMLQVFRGECESIENGRGLYHKSASGSTRILFRHLVEPVAGYSLEIYRSRRDAAGDESDKTVRFIFGSAEACGICESIAGSMSVISFGIPMVIPHASAEVAGESKGRRNGEAA